MRTRIYVNAEVDVCRFVSRQDMPFEVADEMAYYELHNAKRTSDFSECVKDRRRLYTFIQRQSLIRLVLLILRFLW